MISGEVVADSVLIRALHDTEKIVTRMASSFVRGYYELGEVVSKLTTKYGDGTFKKYVAALADYDNIDMHISTTTLYRARQLYDKYPEAIDTLIGFEMSWRQVVAILPLDPPDVLKAIGDAYEDGGTAKSVIASLKAVDTAMGGRGGGAVVTEFDFGDAPAERTQSSKPRGCSDNVKQRSVSDSASVAADQFDDSVKQLMKIIGKFTDSLTVAVFAVDCFKKMPAAAKTDNNMQYTELLGSLRNVRSSIDAVLSDVE